MARALAGGPEGIASTHIHNRILHNIHVLWLHLDTLPLTAHTSPSHHSHLSPSPLTHQELLKHTPIDHPDNYFIEEAVDLLRDELVRMNASIKSCELACSVTRIRSGNRSRSIRRLGNKGRMAGRQLAKQLMK